MSALGSFHDKKKISWHIKDLLGRDPDVTEDVLKWLKPTPSDISRRAFPKRLMARLQAAQLLSNAMKHGGNAGLQSLILDRTEGKVADRLITLDVNDMVRQLEAARQRVIAGAAQDLLPGTLAQTLTEQTPSADTKLLNSNVINDWVRSGDSNPDLELGQDDGVGDPG